MLISISLRAHTDTISLHRLLLPPDTDNIKKIMHGEPHDEADIKLEFEGLDEFLGCPAPCDIYLGRVEDKQRPKKQVLFWQLTGDNMTTTDADKANLTWMGVKVRIHFSGELDEGSSTSENFYYLNNATRPSGSVAVLFPVLVNHKSIAPQTQLLVHKDVTAEPEQTQAGSKRSFVEISNVKNWSQQMSLRNKKAKGS